jgi:hypothetical protein
MHLYFNSAAKFTKLQLGARISSTRVRTRISGVRYLIKHKYTNKKMEPQKDFEKTATADSIFTRATMVGGGVFLGGMGVSLLVPVAMATFGTVVSGVGTMHVAGGVAAILQSTAAACTLSNSILIGTGSIPLHYLRSKL